MTWEVMNIQIYGERDGRRSYDPCAAITFDGRGSVRQAGRSYKGTPETPRSSANGRLEARSSMQWSFRPLGKTTAYPSITACVPCL